MEQGNFLRKALQQGDGPSMGLWQMVPGANVSRALARVPGVDWVVIDCEHGNIDGQFRSMSSNYSPKTETV
jgi:4-hydroxy-2-oxoheptanedioate aldolase